jgi:hypothetical protein
MDVENKDNLFCISIDGSKYSDYGFELTINELKKKGDKLLVLHIFNPNKTDLPYECQSKTIYSKYQTICSNKFNTSDYEIMLQEKKSSSEHALDSLYPIANNKKATAIIMGHQGHKENSLKNELSKGIIYMIKTITIPTFIIKESCSRKSKESGGFTWMIFIEDQDSNSYSSFKESLKFIHPNKDNVIGISVVDNKKETKHDLVKDFTVLCEKAGVKKFSFDLRDRNEEKLGKQLVDIVNFGTDIADFVVVGHNVSKYTHIESSPTVDMIKFAQANVFYFSSNK